MFGVGLDWPIFALAAILIVLAMAGKILGCGLGSIASRLGNKEAIVVGTAMCGRGALELVLLRYGVGLGIISETMFLALVITTLATIIITPILYVYVKKWYVRTSPMGEFA